MPNDYEQPGACVIPSFGIRHFGSLSDLQSLRALIDELPEVLGFAQLLVLATARQVAAEEEVG
jgi:hypothetical protein